MQTSTEKHIGRNADGKLVTFVSTYTTRKDSLEESASQILVSTQEFPFEASSVEIKSPDESPEGKHEKIRETNSGTEDATETQSLDAKGGDIKDLQGDTSKKDQATKDGTLPEINGEQKALHLDNEKSIEMNAPDAKLLEYPELFTLQEDSAQTDSNKNDNGKDMPPKKVVCNSAGCFSSLEELEMFNGMALQARNNFKQMEKEDSQASSGELTRPEGENIDDSTPESR